MQSLTDTSIQWPTWQQLGNVLSLADYNTRVVVIGVTLLGLASGVIGSFLLLRKRSLLGDALSHATLPGIAIAFILMSAAGGSGKWLPGLLVGAAISGVIGVGCIQLIVSYTRLKQDAALGVVLSVFFGLGVAALGLVQKMHTGSAAGLESFIYGKTASMVASDAWLIGLAAAVITAACVLLFKEFALLCFDDQFAGAQGWPTATLDLLMMSLVVGVTVIGLQAVGLILMIALLIIPAAAARFWTEHLPTMVIAAAAIGAISSLLGAAASALAPRLPAGAIIVITAGAVFAVSMALGPARGVLPRALRRLLLHRKIARQHLLRALYELSEPSSEAQARRPTEPQAAAPIEPQAQAHGPTCATAAAQVPPAGRGAVAFDLLLAERAWNRVQLRRLLRSAKRQGLIVRAPQPGGPASDHPAGASAWRLTDAGRRAAWRVTRNHRLWELFLIRYADIAPSHVDRDADQVEHVLDPAIVAELEAGLAAHYPDLAAPPSPHVLAAAHAPPAPGGACA